MKTMHMAGAVGLMITVGASTAFAYSGIGFSGTTCAVYSGSCQPHDDGYYCSNNSWLQCPVNYPPNPWQSFTYNSIQVEMTDYMTNADFKCYVKQVVPAAGVSFYGAIRHSCTPWGGCVDPTPIFYGYNTLFWNLNDSFMALTDGGSLNVLLDYGSTSLTCNNPGGTLHNYRFMTW